VRAKRIRAEERERGRDGAPVGYHTQDRASRGTERRRTSLLRAPLSLSRERSRRARCAPCACVIRASERGAPFGVRPVFAAPVSSQ